jgi:hypothetical protein
VKLSENSGDPAGDFQRWLMKQGVKGMARQVADRVRSTVGAGANPKADVWETATTEPLGDEPPECKWCPICRAARMAQTSGPGMGTVNDTLSGLVQDAFSVLDSVLKPPPTNRSANNRPSSTSPSSTSPSSTSPSNYSTVVGTGVPGWPVVHPENKDGEPADKGGDGDEGGDPGDGPPGRGGEEQVGWPAE